MTKILFFDCETSDPYITRKMGAGWCYPGDDFEVLCVAYAVDAEEPEVTEDMEHLSQLVSDADILVAHNAQYDVGILHRLGIEYKSKTIVDTMLLCKMADNTLMGYGLDSLGARYVESVKDEKGLGEIAISLGLVKSKVQNPASVAKKNMKAIWEAGKDVVGEYAKQDIVITRKLYDKFKDQTGLDNSFYSDLIKSLIEARAAGVRIDLEAAKKAGKELYTLEEEARSDLRQWIGETNINSPKQLGPALQELGIEVPITEKGSPSVTKKWLETVSDEYAVCRLILKIRKYEKARRDFIDNIIGMQQYIPSTDKRYGRVHPEINILGAAATGRASSSNPNIQQIPKRDKEIGPMIRSIFIPESGESWYSLDFSSQEPRLQVHYASMITAKGADILKDGYIQDPTYDLHSVVADIAGITRDQAKVVNLGLCVAGNTTVVTDNGLKKIVDVSPNDKLFDGENFVPHSGVVYSGKKEVFNCLGLHGTEHHEIRTEDSWAELKEVVTSKRLSLSALGLALSKLKNSSLGLLAQEGKGISTLSESVLSAEILATTIERILLQDGRLSVKAVESLKELETGLRNVSRTGSMQQRADVATRVALNTIITGEEGLRSLKSLGAWKHFIGICLRWKVTRIHLWTWIEKIIQEAMNVETSDLSVDLRTSLIGESVDVYDILDVGPNTRFMIVLESGMPMLIHNSYGMGVDKLASTLGVSVDKAKEVLYGYSNKMPYLKELSSACMRRMVSARQITTLGGRKLRYEEGFKYKALNKLIQGSAADQVYTAMVFAYREGIPVLFPVHDELNSSLKDSSKAVRLKEIMENCVSLEVPSYTDVTVGLSWGDLEVLNETN